MNWLSKVLTPVLLIALVGGCGKEDAKEKAATLKSAEIIAVNYPLYYFTQTLAADLATVTLPAPAGTDPAEWNPSADEALKMQQADLVILNGAGYSNWLDKVSLTNSKLIDTSAAFRDEFIALDQQTTHSHGPEAEHSHSGYAFTTWMDIGLAKLQVHSVALALEKNWPEDTKAIAQRENVLIEKLSALDDAYKKQAALLAGRMIIYSHPVYQYFERRYQLPGHSLHWEPDQQPSGRQWSELERLINNSSDALFVWEDFPSDVTMERLNAMNIQIVVIRPAANKSDKDWYSEQEENIRRLNECCSDPSS